MRYTVEENGNVRVSEDDDLNSYTGINENVRVNEDGNLNSYIGPPPQYTNPLSNTNGNDVGNGNSGKGGCGCGCFITIVVLIILFSIGYVIYNQWTKNSDDNRIETSVVIDLSQPSIEISEDQSDLEYIIIGSDKRYISESELDSLTADEVCLARNEIFARHGRIFTTEWIHNYFISKSWYEEKYSPDEFDSKIDTIFNEYEKGNVKMIQQYEKKKGYR